MSPLCSNTLNFLDTLLNDETINQIIVFGSRALGDYDVYSDLDLAIDAPLMTKFKWLKLKEYVTYDLNVWINISLVNYALNPIKLKQRINETGVVIYERNK